MGACARTGEPQRSTSIDGGSRDASRQVANAAPSPSGDAAPLDAETIPTGEVVVGQEAEQLIGQGRTRDLVGEPPEAAPQPTATTYEIDPDGVGPFRLGSSRADTARAFRWRSEWKTMPTPPGAPGVESATILGEAGQPLLRLKVLAGRLTEIAVLARDRRAATVSGLQVGTLFKEALDAHGDPRLVTSRTGQPLGFVMADLPGVLFVAANPASRSRSAPPPGERIARIVVVGPEATAPED